jgi:hypothetical protein
VDNLTLVKPEFDLFIGTTAMGEKRQLACALALCCVAVAAAIPLPARKPLPRGTDAPLVEVVTLHEALCPGLCSRSTWLIGKGDGDNNLCVDLNRCRLCGRGLELLRPEKGPLVHPEHVNTVVWQREAGARQHAHLVSVARAHTHSTRTHAHTHTHTHTHTASTERWSARATRCSTACKRTTRTSTTSLCIALTGTSFLAVRVVRDIHLCMPVPLHVWILVCM